MNLETTSTIHRGRADNPVPQNDTHGTKNCIDGVLYQIMSLMVLVNELSAMLIELASYGEAQRRARIHKLRLEEGAKKAAEELEKYDPNNDTNISGDPYKTLFVARLNYETTESKIKREFEAYGPIKRICLVMEKESNKPRGDAFIEYIHTWDMKAAYKQADGKKLDNIRVLVDVECG
ncbi:hypothetical protein TEA_000277 [Camellia sinensis var. sinensis]|uniref:U1 small nuclear ribonucleoprotein 70 kDa n=1 Tax=Camellia sinensis var. sinensis TaxID=542762 RepID=A0A4S4EX84_CAMSN|nr:hypothetical protein TEA_000277 [Camellia sinensis var. sinensis]